MRTKIVIEDKRMAGLRRLVQLGAQPRIRELKQLLHSDRAFEPFGIHLGLQVASGMLRRSMIPPLPWPIPVVVLAPRPARLV